MPDLIEKLHSVVPPTDWDSPTAVKEDWKIIFDGFIPAANNVMLVGKYIASKKGCDHFYVTCVGNNGPAGITKCTRGDDINPGFVQDCQITYKYYLDHGLDGLQKEATKALDRLIHTLEVEECHA